MIRAIKSLVAKESQQSKGIAMTKVSVQKGPIHCNMPTLKTMTYPQRVRDREQEVMERRDGQTLKMHEPRSRKK